jgi:formate dehydrogenase subunit delta
MDIHRLIKMANEIGAFFESEPDRTVAMEGIAGHIKRFWDPRMRRELLSWVDEHAGEGLKELVLAALRGNRDKLLPRVAATQK